MEKSFENIIKHLFKIYLNREPTNQELIYHISSVEQNGIKFKRKEFLNSQELYDIVKMGSFPKRKTVENKKNRTENLEKRVALCLSGHSRKFEIVFPYIKENLVDELNADVFMHTWDDIGNQIQLSRATIGPKPDSSKKMDAQKIFTFFNIKDYIIENNEEVMNDFKLNDNKYYLYCAGGNERIGFHASAEPKYIMSQLYSIYMSNELKKKYEEKNAFKYDLVIKMRMDYAPNNSISNEEIRNCVQKNIYVPNHIHSNHGHPSCNVCTYEQHEDEHTSDVCDVFAYGSSANMDHYCSLYMNAIDLYEKMLLENEDMIKKYKLKFQTYKNFNLVHIWKNKQYHEINCFYPERLLKKHLQGYRLLPSLFNGDVKR